MKDINKIIFIKNKEKIKLEKELDYLNYIIEKINFTFSKDSIPIYLDNYESLISNYQELCENREMLEQKEYEDIQKEIHKIKENLNPYIKKLKNLHAIHFNLYRLNRWFSIGDNWIIFGSISIISIMCFIILFLFI